VFATIDGLLHSPEVFAATALWLPIQFDAYALAETAESGQFRIGTAHSHALAQVTQALQRYQVLPQPAASNGAALANLAPGQVAFGPPGYQRPGVVTIGHDVGDFADARTQFVLLAPNPALQNGFPVILRKPPSGAAAESQPQTLLAVTPTNKGPGVLARITQQFARRNLNLSALISRPIKGQAGTYVFIVTVDATPTDPTMQALLSDLRADGDTLKILGSWPNAMPSFCASRAAAPTQNLGPIKQQAPSEIQNVAVIGLGLIGGSVALRCVKRGLNVIGYDAAASTRSAAQPYFPVAPSLAAAVQAADIVVLAVPLVAMSDTIVAMAPHLKPSATITDVGSIKSPVRDAVAAAGLSEYYVGGHPMAGNEHSGFTAADPDLLVGAPWALTRPAAEQGSRYNEVYRWVTDTFDANIVELTDAEHDQAQALISGLPHVFAVELLNQLADSPVQKTAQNLAAGSFKDGTRVAHTDPDRTAALVTENAQQIAPLIRKAARHFTELADQLSAGQLSAEKLSTGQTPEFFHHGDSLR